MMASASSSSSLSLPSNHKKLIIVLAGPTAVGKSSIGSKLCSREMASDILTNHALYNTNNGENENVPSTSTSTSTTCRGHIISADSVQTYQGVQIGANKPTKEEIERTPHHLINIVDGDSVCQYNAADWMNDALHVIHKLTNYDNYPQITNEGTGDSSDENDTGYRGGKENENEEKEFGEELILELKKRRGRIDKYISDSLHLSSNGDNLDGSESVVGDSDTVAANSTVLPVIVGGTMMYLQWLVHGRPDAMKPSKDALNKAALTVAQFQRQEEENEKEEEIQQATTVTPIADVEEVSQSAENSASASASASTPNTNTNETEQNPPTGWQAAVDHVSSLGPIFAERVSKLPGKDWYRLRRTLEVAYTVLDDVENKINIEDLFNGQREGGLDSMEYDVRCFFLCPDDRMAHTAVIDSRCEDMILSGLLKETTDLSLAGLLPTGGQQARAIGYRQTLDYLNRESATEKDAASFGQYLDDFTAATRRYAKKQMQWFRRDDKFIFVPVKLSDPSSTRVDAAANMIRDMCVLPRQDFEKELLPPPPKTGKDSRANDEMGGNLSISAKTKLENEKQGKGMKFYRGVRHKLIEGSDAYGRIIIEADECTSRIKDLP